jgi:hypothetical protein
LGDIFKCDLAAFSEDPIAQVPESAGDSVRHFDGKDRGDKSQKTHEKILKPIIPGRFHVHEAC